MGLRNDFWLDHSILETCLSYIEWSLSVIDLSVFSLHKFKFLSFKLTFVIVLSLTIKMILLEWEGKEEDIQY
jgi:hypothetical protein